MAFVDSTGQGKKVQFVLVNVGLDIYDQSATFLPCWYTTQQLNTEVICTRWMVHLDNGAPSINMISNNFSWCSLFIMSFDAAPMLGPTLGALEIGVLLSTLLYGTVFVQTISYFQAQFTDDHTSIRLMVSKICKSSS
jgi:hypothetical protein